VIPVDKIIEVLRELDPRVRLGIGAVAVLLIVVAIVAIASRPGPTIATQSPSPTPSVTPVPTATVPRPRETPPGTPAPRPSTFVGLANSIQVSPVPAPRQTPVPETGLWRLEGYMVDEQGKPIENACVVIGPVGCKPFSPHTDERGYYFIDIAAVSSAMVPLQYDFYFEIPGRETIWLRLTPSGFSTFNAVMRRT
jgi:hypothetical protein